MRTMRIAVVLVGGLLLATLLAGCSEGSGRINEELHDALDPLASQSSATLDLDATLEGSWDAVVLACTGATSSEISTALGFEWKYLAPDQTNYAMFILVEGESVADFYVSGDRRASREPWIYPCVPPALKTSPEPNVVRLERSEAIVSLVLEKEQFGRPLWYLVPGK